MITNDSHTSNDNNSYISNDNNSHISNNNNSHISNDNNSSTPNNLHKSYFSHVYVINMKKRTDKKLLMKLKLDLIGIDNYTFYEGIDGSNPSYHDMYKNLNNLKNFTSKGALGLVLTYVNLLKDIQQKNYDNVLILEDDVNVHKSYHELMKSFEKIINDDKYDIVWLGANQIKMTETQLAETIKNYCYTPEPENVNTNGTFSIALKKSAVNKMMKIINESNIKNFKPIDLMLNDFIKDNLTTGITGIVCYPYIFMPDVSCSDNIGPRNQQQFSRSRGYKFNDYHYVICSDITNIVQLIKSGEITCEKFIKISQLKEDETYLRNKNIFDLIRTVNNETNNLQKIFSIEGDDKKLIAIYDLFKSGN
jgi:GR25 family glycosyltransferase involved in LPS biosynthesis